MKTHVMVDIETLSTRADAAILSLGAIRFDPLGTNGGWDTFYEAISIQSNLEAGRRIDGDTLLWWLRQSDEARAALQDCQHRETEYYTETILSLGIIKTPSNSLYGVLERFAEWIGKDVPERIWSHGAGFDLEIIKSAYHGFGLKEPWKAKTERDTRTLFDIVPVPMALKGTVAHHALKDAIKQAEQVQYGMSQIQRVEAIAQEQAENMRQEVVKSIDQSLTTGIKND